MKILLVTTAFYPEQAIGAVRISKIAKFLHAAGDELSIISLDPAPWSARDESLHFEGLESLTWIRLGQSQLFNLTLGRLRRVTVGDRSALVAGVSSSSSTSISVSIRRQLIMIAQFIFTSLKALDWVIKVRHHAHKTLAGQTFDIILTSYPSLASPFAGLALKWMRLAPHLVIDFRDPISYGNACKHSLLHWLGRYLVSQCSIASFVSSGVCTRMTARAGETKCIKIIVPNGYDSDDRLNANAKAIIKKKKQIHLALCYVGSLYHGKSDLGPVLQAIASAFDSGDLEHGSLVIYYAGNDGAFFKYQASKYCLDDIVVDLGKVSRRESLALQNSSDICLLSTWNTSENQGILTGKMFEFFLMKKPVLAVVSGNVPESETKSILLRVGGGFCFEEGAADPVREHYRLKEWIINQYRVKITHCKLFCTYNDNVTQYEYRKIVDELRAAMSNLLVKKP